MSDTTMTVIARYLAVGGAHVTVERGGKSACGHSHDRWPYERHPFKFDATCEACGLLLDKCAKGVWSTGGIRTPVEGAAVELLRAAQEHAQSCRRIPKRLWPEATVNE